MQGDADCVFCKIVRGEIPSRKVYEDADVLAFHDINPLAPVHFMLIPKRHVGSLYDVVDNDAPVMGRKSDVGHCGERDRARHRGGHFAVGDGMRSMTTGVAVIGAKPFGDRGHAQS